jgi:hypothetical protein
LAPHGPQPFAAQGLALASLGTKHTFESPAAPPAHGLHGLQAPQAFFAPHGPQALTFFTAHGLHRLAAHGLQPLALRAPQGPQRFAPQGLQAATWTIAVAGWLAMGSAAGTVVPLATRPANPTPAPTAIAVLERSRVLKDFIAIIPVD